MARSTPRPIGNRRSTGSASRAGRPSGRWTSWASSSCGRDSRTRTSTRSGPSSSRRSGRTSTTPRSTSRSCSSRRCSATARWGARSAATRPGSAPCRVRRSATSGTSPTGPRTRSSPWPAISATTRRCHSPRPRSGPATAPSRGSSRRPRCPRVRDSSAVDGTRARRNSRWASRRCRATIRTRGRSPCSTRSSATACRVACSCRFARRRGSPTTSRPASSSTQTPAHWRCPRASTRRSCPLRSRRSCASSRACATSRSQPRSWPRPRRTSVVAWSCGWTTRAISRHGSAARRRSTTGSTRWMKRWRRSAA